MNRSGRGACPRRWESGGKPPFLTCSLFQRLRFLIALTQRLRINLYNSRPFDPASAIIRARPIVHHHLALQPVPARRFARRSFRQLPSASRHLTAPGSESGTHARAETSTETRPRLLVQPSTSRDSLGLEKSSYPDRQRAAASLRPSTRALRSRD